MSTASYIASRLESKEIQENGSKTIGINYGACDVLGETDKKNEEKFPRNPLPELEYVKHLENPNGIDEDPIGVYS